MQRASWIWVCAAVLGVMVACATDEEDGPECGDNVCNGGETTATCAADCPAPNPNTPPPPPSGPASLVTVNQSTYTVYSLYVATCGATTWGPDQLGANVIQPNGQFTLTGIPAGCWQLRAETQGSTRYWQRFNVSFAPGSQLTWTLGN